VAKRPVFIVSKQKPFYKEELVEFEYFSGFAVSQKQKCIESLHQAFLKNNINMKVLEISSKSKQKLGIELSAFNLMIETKKGQKYSVESAFQSSKVFENGGPYTDLLLQSSKIAKKDNRLKNSGRLKYFKYGNRVFDLYPKTFFYDWLYVNALYLNKDLAKQVLEFDAFTDIEFNPNKAINCQARSAAIFVSLYRNQILDKAIKNEKAFLNEVYISSRNEKDMLYDQMSLLNKI
jgi:type I restriction enzyme M protein